MDNMHRYFLLLILMSLVGGSFAQKTSTKRFGISVSTGYAIPVGSYAHSDANEAATWHDYGGDGPHFQGYSKSKNGFAEKGRYSNIEFNYFTKHSWYLVLRGGVFTNPVAVENISIHYGELWGHDPVTVEHVDYNMRYLLPGIGYQFSKNRFDIELAILTGVAKSTFPYYITYNSWTNPPDWYYSAHHGPQPDLYSFMVGANGQLIYTFDFGLFIGMEFTYLYSGFKYTSDYRWNVGSLSFPLEDKLNVHVINAGLNLGIRF